MQKADVLPNVSRNIIHIRGQQHAHFRLVLPEPRDPSCTRHSFSSLSSGPCRHQRASARLEVDRPFFSCYCAVWCYAQQSRRGTRSDPFHLGEGFRMRRGHLGSFIFSVTQLSIDDRPRRLSANRGRRDGNRRWCGRRVEVSVLSHRKAMLPRWDEQATSRRGRGRGRGEGRESYQKERRKCKSLPGLL